MTYLSKTKRAFKNGFAASRAARAVLSGYGTMSAYRRIIRRGTKTARKTRTRRGRTRTITRRKRSRETFATNAEYSRKTVSMGRRPRKNLRGAWKMLKQNQSSNLYGFSLYSPFGGTTGSVQLLNTSTTSTTGTFNVPMQLYDITAAPQPTNTAPNVRWVPTFSNPSFTGTLSWASDTPISVVNTDNGTTNAAYPMGNDTLDWVRAKMIFYCPTTIPCRIQIDMIQLTDTRLVPDSSVTPVAFSTAFWQAAVKRFAYSPLESGDHKYNKYFKRLYSDSFIMHPKETTENVATTMREVNIFKRFNRRCTYNWQDNDVMQMVGQDTQVNTGSAISAAVHPRARIFLMIRAQANNGTAFSNTIMPSYDIKLDMKHSQLSS